MSGNAIPIFSKVGDIQWGTADGNTAGAAAGPLKTANTAKDGTGAVLIVFAADGTNGGYVQRIRFRAAGSCTATVARVFINNGSTNATAANNILWDEITLAGTTLSETAALVNYELTMNLMLPPSYRVMVTLGTTVSAGYYVTVVGGKY